MPTFFFLITLLFSASALASPFTLPEGASLTQENSAKAGLYRLPLGRARTVDGRWQFEKVQWIQSSNKQSQDWSLDNRENYQDTAQLIRQSIKQSQATLLYQCQGLACGSSNIWANKFFQNWHLYGRDEQQYFWALQQGSDYYMLYLIERGNQQVNLHIQHLKAEQQNPSNNRIEINAQCQHTDLDKILSHSSSQEQWLLIISLPNDWQQQQSLEQGKQCLTQFKKQWPKANIQLLALGALNLRLEKVNAPSRYLQLMP